MVWECVVCVAVQILSDIPMAQFIVNLNASMPASQKFIIHVLDNTHFFVQPHAAEMIRSAISEFRDQNSYEKPT
ncbi:TFIIH subunit TTDA/Tfb5 - like 1 [Theobroma cacao]|nr:TFIIH subunit TTDA/Tfb5 - like 1 [Theobroma cacao]